MSAACRYPVWAQSRPELHAALPDRQRRLAKLQAVRAPLEHEKGARLTPTHQKIHADPEANMLRVGNHGALTCVDNA